MEENVTASRDSALASGCHDVATSLDLLLHGSILQREPDCTARQGKPFDWCNCSYAVVGWSINRIAIASSVATFMRTAQLRPSRICWTLALGNSPKPSARRSAKCQNPCGSAA